MRVRALKLENFRCFADVELDLSAMGLIGVRGRNGAGKSSLLEALDFALYGQRYGVRAKRSSAGAGDRLRVYVELDVDAHRVEVERTETDASLRIDGVTRAQGRAETTKQVGRLLGLSRDQFAATFYARQKEVQSFADPSSRRSHIERLLGLTQLRRATQLAGEHAKRQLVVVETLQAEAGDVEEAKRLLEERREEAKKNAPLVQAARQRRDDLQARRSQAWEELKAAQERATQAEQARSARQLAAQEHRTAVEQHEAAVAALKWATDAAQEVERLAPLAARVAELQAQVREHEQRQQRHEQFVGARDRRAEVQRARAALADQLAARPAPDPTAEELRRSVTTRRDWRDKLNTELLEATERVAEHTRRHEQAQRQSRVRTRLAELDRQLTSLPRLREQEERSRGAQAALEGRRAELEHQLDAEHSHREEVERDGPHAECPRCRRLYGDSFQAILTRFTTTIAELDAELASVQRTLGDARADHERCRAQLQRLERLQGERESLPDDELEPPLDAGRIETELEEARAELDGFRGSVADVTNELADLHALVEAAAEHEAAREELIAQRVQLKAEEDLLSAQLDATRAAGYDPPAHEETLGRHAEALGAAERCAELRHQAEGHELARQRAATLGAAVEEAAAKLSAAEAAASAHEGSDDRLKAVQQQLRTMEAEISEAEAQLRGAEHRATSENEEVKAAESALKRALADRRKVQSAKREHRYADATADGLQQYTAHAQRHAVPMLEKDTAEFLSRLTASRYSDVVLDESGALEIVDDGEPRPLKRFSGGEQDLANLCLRLALSRAFADQRSADPGLIILDEVFGSQDLDRRQGLLEHFRELNRVFSQVFIVSHFDDVANACDVQIQVERGATISTAALVP